MEIYNQYIIDYTNINNVIHGLDCLDYSIRSQPQAVSNRLLLLQIQSNIYQIYSQSKTLLDYKTATESLNSQVIEIANNYLINITPLPPPVVPVIPVTPPVVPAVVGNIEHSAWYITWTSWDFPVPSYVNTVNLFVGNITSDLVIGGFGNVTDVGKFASTMKEAGIKVKASLGGGGGSYDNLWNVITNDNVQQIANNLTDYCHTNGLSGIDFDIENFNLSSDNTAQQILCGTLIKYFKQNDPTLETSYCVNAGFGISYPWQVITTNILSGSMDTNKNVSIDRIYIMSYYNTLEDEEGWVSGWVQWFTNFYNFDPSRISIGIDDTDSKSYDIGSYSAFAKSQGLSTAYWMYNPSTADSSNQSLQTIYNSYQ